MKYEVTDAELKASTILMVDDNPDNLFLLETLFSSAGFTTLSADGGQQAIDIVQSRYRTIDLIILDIMMPDVDGLAVTRTLKGNRITADIPILLLTAKLKERGDVARGMELGAEDYLTKPVDNLELVARVKNLLRMKKLEDRLRTINDELEQIVEERTIEVMLTRDAAIFGLAKLAEYRDNETGAHLDRVRNYTRIVGETLLKQGAYPDVVDEEFVRTVAASSVLHDIGKVGIPDAILQKPGKLTPDEFDIMKTHAALGGQALTAAAARMPLETSFLSVGRDIAWHHHEKWNGTGYPDRLAGEDIPLAARIMAITDVFDALISKRVYKEAFPYEKARRIIVEERGAHFDPTVVDAFLAGEEQLLTIRDRFDILDRAPS